MEIEDLLLSIIGPVFGFLPLDEQAVKAATAQMDEKLKMIEAVLKKHKFLVGQNISIADIALALPLLWLFRLSYAEGKRKNLCPLVEKWIQTVVDVPEVHYYTGRT